MEILCGSVVWKSCMEVMCGNYVWKSCMEICYGSLAWKFCMEIVYGNFVWKLCMEILYGNCVWKLEAKAGNHVCDTQGNQLPEVGGTARRRGLGEPLGAGSNHLVLRSCVRTL